MKFHIPSVPQAEISRAQDAIMSGSEEQISAYRAYYATLDPQLQARLGYALAAIFHLKETFGLPAYLFAFRRDLTKLKTPLSWLGWAGEDSDVGPAFALDPACFDRGPVTLYYSDDDLQIYSPAVREERIARAQYLAADIAAHSSGLADVHAVVLPGRHSSVVTSPDQADGLAEETCAVAFTLDPAAIKPTLIIQGRTYDTENCGGYVFVLPRSGEFDCTIGQLFDDNLRLPLRTDSYCMK